MPIDNKPPNLALREKLGTTGQLSNHHLHSIISHASM